MPNGIPQGSGLNLGPLPFVLYINDLLVVVKSNMLTIADDINI